MSAKSEQLEGELNGERADEVCASCGVAAIDGIKLNLCDGGCDLVKCCSNGCQTFHREQHEEECKTRKAELHDKELFTQPDGSHLGECPICCLPLPLDISKSIMMPCCSKWICDGCCYANMKREMEEGLEHRCVYCRNPGAKSQEEVDKNIMKRIKKYNDPAAMAYMGKMHYNGGYYARAAEYWTKAAELGDKEAHYCMGSLYHEGQGVEKDVKKLVYHCEQAAIGGHPDARYNLAIREMKNKRADRAAKHVIIAAKLGFEPSLKAVKDLFVKGEVSKEEYAAALRAHQAAVDATKSAEREKAEEAKRCGVYRS